MVIANYNWVKSAAKRVVKARHWNFQLTPECLAVAFFTSSAGCGYLVQPPQLSVVCESLPACFCSCPKTCVIFGSSFMLGKRCRQFCLLSAPSMWQWACIKFIFGLCRLWSCFVWMGNVKKLPVTVHPLFYADCTFKGSWVLLCELTTLGLYEWDFTISIGELASSCSITVQSTYEAIS